VVRIEGAFDPHLLVEVGLAEHFRHQVALLHADAVLAGQHAADLDAKAQDIGAKTFGLLQFARHVGVVEDQRMQIAVAGVKDVGDAAVRIFPKGRACRPAHCGSSLRGMVPSMQ
jgi:hypothetical protein